MFRPCLPGRLLLLSMLACALGVGSAAAQDYCPSCPTVGYNSGRECFSCQRFHCPPPLYHCMERAPCIKWKCGCPKPVCCPCDQPNWGYFQTCWSPWPWPPDWSHCPVQPPAAVVYPGLMQPQVVPLDNGAMRKPGL